MHHYTPPQSRQPTPDLRKVSVPLRRLRRLGDYVPKGQRDVPKYSNFPEETQIVAVVWERSKDGRAYMAFHRDRRQQVSARERLDALPLLGHM